MASPIIAGIIAGGSILVQTFSQFQAARAQASALDATARAERSAAEFEAEATRESARAEEAQSRRRAASILGRQRAIGAASGLDISSGSPLLLELDSVREAEIEALTIRRSGENVAQSRRFTGRTRSAIARFQARSVRRQIPLMLVGGLARAGATGLVAARAFGSSSEPPFAEGF